MPYRDLAFVVQTIKTSEGGEKLSQEALSLIVIFAYDELKPDPEFFEIKVLLSAHEYIWKDKSLSVFHRLEVCNWLFDLVSNILLERNKESCETD